MINLEIPKGLATRLGQAGTALLAAAAGVTTLLAGNHQSETKTFATLATAVAIATIIGRMLQAAAQVFGQASHADPPTVDPARDGRTTPRQNVEQGS